MQVINEAIDLLGYDKNLDVVRALKGSIRGLKMLQDTQTLDRKMIEEQKGLI